MSEEKKSAWINAMGTIIAAIAGALISGYFVLQTSVPKSDVPKIVDTETKPLHEKIDQLHLLTQRKQASLDSLVAINQALVQSLAQIRNDFYDATGQRPPSTPPIIDKQLPPLSRTLSQGDLTVKLLRCTRIGSEVDCHVELTNKGLKKRFCGKKGSVIIDAKGNEHTLKTLRGMEIGGKSYTLLPGSSCPELFREIPVNGLFKFEGFLPEVTHIRLLNLRINRQDFEFREVEIR